MNFLMKAAKGGQQSVLMNYFSPIVKRTISENSSAKKSKIEEELKTKEEEVDLSDILHIGLTDEEKKEQKMEEKQEIQKPINCHPTSWNEEFYFDVEGTWSALLQKEHEKPYFKRILSTLKTQEKQGVTIFPKRENVFNALKYCSFENIKVIILGQDPYHDVGQAHGLSFSVPKGILIPPSLRNIFKEISTDMNIPVNTCTDLTCWAKQGVLLLNTLLTVPAHTPLGHKSIGWDQYTSEIIKIVSSKTKNKVFLLWGKPAQSKIPLIDQSKHLILKTVHPSPLSANRGFFGCKHFSKTNEYLKEHGEDPIDWSTHYL